MKGRGFFATFVAALIAVGLAALPAAADHVPGEGSRDFMTTAQAMFADPAQVTGAEAIAVGPDESDHRGIMTSPAGSFAAFPTNGPSFGMISTGDTDLMNDPNNEGSLSTVLDGLNNNESPPNDLVGFSITFNAPAGANCLNADVKMLSEEFPEYVGTQYNDFAGASINNPATPTVDVSTFDPSVPGNFLFDGSFPPNELEINTSQLVSAAAAAGTTYDGATPTLFTQVPVSPGASNTVRFWTGDVGDSVWDTTLFVDNILIIPKDPCPTETKGPSLVKGVKAKVKGGKAIISGQILPPAPGGKVFLTFFANGSPLRKVAKGKDKLNSQSKFSKKFKIPGGATRCMVKVNFKGDAGHFPSKAKKKFSC
jgi:hypothetical protein